MLWDSLSELLEVVGWAEFTRLALPMHEHLCWEFLNSLRVEWSNLFQNRHVHIKFRFFNQNFETNLPKFD